MPETWMRCLTLLCALALSGLTEAGNGAEPVDSHRPNVRQRASSFNLVVPAHPYDLILARPESSSISLSVLAYQDGDGIVAYGPHAGAYTTQTPVQKLRSGVPVEVVVSPLHANTRYYYRFRWRPRGAAAF